MTEDTADQLIFAHGAVGLLALGLTALALPKRPGGHVLRDLCVPAGRGCVGGGSFAIRRPRTR